MKYKKYMQEIMQELNQYKEKVDEMATAYVAEKTKHEKQLQSMEGKYTESYITEQRQNWQPKVNYRGVVDLAREVYQTNAMNYCNELQSELDNYFRVPVDSGLAATLTAVKSLGITLSNKEFEVLQGGANGYWGLRLLNEAAASRTEAKLTAKVEDGQTKSVKEEISRPYSGVELPSINEAYDRLNDLKNTLTVAFKYYSGANCELKDITFPVKQENVNIEKEYKVKPAKPMRDTMTIAAMASSVKFFDENHQTYVAFSEMMESLAATMPKTKKKETLTDDDKKLIDTLIDGKYESLAKEKAVQIAEIDEHLAEILRLDERYGTVVKMALGEVSENE